MSTSSISGKKQLFENGALAAFENTGKNHRKPQEDAKDRKIAALEEKLQRKNEGSLRADGGTRPAKKSSWGTLNGLWVPHDTRDNLVDFVKRWSDKTGITVACFLLWIGLATSKWHSWKHRYGKANEHNAWIPRDHWLEAEEKKAILDYHDQNPLEGYRRLTFMMLDANVVACSPASVYRVLKEAGLLERLIPSPR